MGYREWTSGRNDGMGVEGNLNTSVGYLYRSNDVLTTGLGQSLRLGGGTHNIPQHTKSQHYDAFGPLDRGDVGSRLCFVWNESCGIFPSFEVSERCVVQETTNGPEFISRWAMRIAEAPFDKFHKTPSSTCIWIDWQ
jgi:hypothetical protein